MLRLFGISGATALFCWASTAQAAVLTSDMVIDTEEIQTGSFYWEASYPAGLDVEGLTAKLVNADGESTEFDPAAVVHGRRALRLQLLNAGLDPNGGNYPFENLNISLFLDGANQYSFDSRATTIPSHSFGLRIPIIKFDEVRVDFGNIAPEFGFEGDEDSPPQLTIRMQEDTTPIPLPGSLPILGGALSVMTLLFRKRSS